MSLNRYGEAASTGSVIYKCANCGNRHNRTGADYNRRMTTYGRVWCQSCLKWLGLLKRIDEDAGREHHYLAAQLHSFSK